MDPNNVTSELKMDRQVLLVVRAVLQLLQPLVLHDQLLGHNLLRQVQPLQDSVLQVNLLERFLLLQLELLQTIHGRVMDCLEGIVARALQLWVLRVPLDRLLDHKRLL